MVREILRLGNPALYEVCDEIQPGELAQVKEIVGDLHDTLVAFREKYNAGRAIAAPQIGYKKRLVYMYVNETPTVFINPVLTGIGDERIEVMDDCMSFPGLLVKVSRHKRLRIEYKDMEFQDCVQEFGEGKSDLSELLQHECDHLDGVLATMRAIDSRSFFMDVPTNS